MSAMNDLAFTWPTLAAFGAASLVLAITPGPAVVYIVTRTLVQGRKAGLVSVIGVALTAFSVIPFGEGWKIWAMRSARRSGWRRCSRSRRSPSRS